MRNNQRRSRARRKEYVAELEEKICRYETSEGQTTTDQTVQLLTKENDTLRRLLQSIGLGNDFVKAYTNAFGLALELSKTVAQPGLQAQLDNRNCCGAKRCSSPKISQESSAASPSTGLQTLSPLDAYLNLDAADPSQPPKQDQPMPSQPTEIFPWEFSFDFSSYFDDAARTFQVPGPLSIPPISAQVEGDPNAVEGSKSPIKQEDTTLCSVAFSLIMISNRRGYNTADLDLKLRTGYRYYQATFEGCRTDNGILLRVLTEIM